MLRQQELYIYTSLETDLPPRFLADLWYDLENQPSYVKGYLSFDCAANKVCSSL